jgi:hypothetical protein
MMPPLAGYALLRTPESALHRYEASLFARENVDELARLRASLSSVEPTLYRGISRDPLELLPECVPDEPDARALTLMRDLVLVDPASIDPIVHLLPDRPAALRVHELLDNPLEYEIAFVSRDPAVSVGDSFGFDIGYWGGDHFSLICDAAIAPRWHPPDPDDYAQLAVQLRALNAHSLFPTREHARAFSAFYQSRSWAESELEPGQFVIIEVGAG